MEISTARTRSGSKPADHMLYPYTSAKLTLSFGWEFTSYPKVGAWFLSCIHSKIIFC